MSAFGLPGGERPALAPAPLVLVLSPAGGGGAEYAERRLAGRVPGGGGVLCVDPPGAGETRRLRRPERWGEVVLEGGDVAAALEGRRSLGVLLDGFDRLLRSVWPHDEERAEALALSVAAAVQRAAGLVAVIVSRETGMGTDPESAVETAFRDRLQAANRALAAAAAEVVLVVAGVPVRLRGGDDEDDDG